MEFLGPILILLSLTLPIVLAIYILRQIDHAAKNRRAKVKIFIVDFFSLIFMIQLPFVLLRDQMEEPGVIAGAIVFALVMILVWWTTVRMVSQAGIQTTGWRSLVSIIVIPATYFGAFGLLGCAVGIANPKTFRTSLVIGAFLLVGMIVSLLLTRAALKAARTPSLASGELDATE